MLAELSIKNFAIIESLSISFEKGLTVLTGETGAGKSIIIDAINLLIGGRGSSEFVRHGEDKAELEGLFLIEGENHQVIQKLTEFGIDAGDGMAVLRRDISSSGKSVCRVNGKLVTIAVLREIGGALVDIHSQNEHQELMNPDLHLPLLDHFGGREAAAALKEYQELYKRYEQAVKQLKSLNKDEQQMAHRLDLLQFQFDEITKSDLKLKEDEELYEERQRISNFERIHASLQAAYHSLGGEQKGLDFIGMAMNDLEEAASLDSSFDGLNENVANSFYLLEDAISEIRNQLDSLEFDPVRLDFIEGRLNEINGLKRKYGKTVEDILEYAAGIEEEIETLLNRETHIAKIEKEMASIRKDLLVEAKNLSIIRQKYAKKLVGQIHKELKDLYMEKTVFNVEFLQSASEHGGMNERIQKDGMDVVEFYISTNPGEPLKPLSKIASGGELSRIILALKNIFSEHQGITSIIFDEVDTGVSGRVAQSMAEKIYKVSVGSQVLCISHLPQVAAMADTHLFISKQTLSGRTRTKVHALSQDEKIREIGRMISGVEITELTKEHARELLQLASQIKSA
ncbi:DNA repair protein RecN [Peribacillus kribbensis]|uniref:DNA repair protein RecN n=1 Tax=Peribacillus kribbensis TaxID=356658 RepID=UPI00041A7F78|nr:DNA repair protein RecN [Peribacillus kribbensis]